MFLIDFSLQSSVHTEIVVCSDGIGYVVELSHWLIFCGVASETIMHLFIRCPFSRACWFPIGLRWETFDSIQQFLPDCLFTNFVLSLDCGLICTVLLTNWNVHNDILFGTWLHHSFYVVNINLKTSSFGFCSSIGRSQNVGHCVRWRSPNREHWKPNIGAVMVNRSVYVTWTGRHFGGGYVMACDGPISSVDVGDSLVEGYATH